MSLFQLCSWWSTQSPELQMKYDSSSLYCSRLGLEENEKDYVIVGSHTGHLSIYQPKSEKLKDGTSKGFQPMNVVFETKLTLPILAIATGNFSTVSKTGINLALLHPMKLCVYSITKIVGVTEHGDQSKLQLICEQTFTKFAYSLCKGHFGGVKGREFLCVLHMDGNMRFYEQDGISFECKLFGDRTIPSSLQYIPRIDSFVTVSPDWNIECIRYQDISQSNNDIAEVTPYWKYCIGEDALDLAIHQISDFESVIVVLGEHNLYCLTDTGKTKFVKRLDYLPICFCTFVIGWYWEPDARLMIAVASDSGSLLIYENMNLVWTAKLLEIPISLKRANLEGLAGAIVCLGEEGNVTIGYLGSEPQIFKVPPLNLKELNYEKTQQELVELEKEIKIGVDVTDLCLINAATERDLEVQICVMQKLEKCEHPNVQLYEIQDEPKMCLINVNLKFNNNVDLLQIHFSVLPPLKCSMELHTLRNITKGHSEIITTWVYVGHYPIDIPTLNLSVIVSFINKQSIPRLIEKCALLPVDLIFKQCQPQKDAKIKVTITTENISKDLNSVFFDVMKDTGIQALGLQSLYTESIVTVVAAKSSNRFRIQSDHITALSSVFDVILRRLISDNSDTELIKETPYKIPKLITSPQIPVDDIMNIINEHFETINEFKILMLDLGPICGQIRLLERRFLMKIQDKTPGALGGITNLLKNTHSNLSVHINLLKIKQEELKRMETKLSCVLFVVVNLLKSLNLPPKITESLQNILLNPSTDWHEKSWEETIAYSLDMLNYVGPLKKNKNTTLDEHRKLSVTKFDIDQFKKQLIILFERIFKMVTTKSNTGETDETLPNNNKESITSIAITTSSNNINDFGKIIIKNNEHRTNDLIETDETSEWVNDINAFNNLFQDI